MNMDIGNVHQAALPATSLVFVGQKTRNFSFSRNDDVIRNLLLCYVQHKLASASAVLIVAQSNRQLLLSLIMLVSSLLDFLQ